MQTSAEIGELATALAAAQGELTFAHKDAQNPAFRSTYATLASVWDSVRPALCKHGLAVAQVVEGDESGVTLTTRLLHKSGQFIEGTVKCRPGKGDAQGMASAATYLKRLGLAAIVGIAPDSDDDGNEASNHTGARQSPANDRPAPATRSEALRPTQVTPDPGNGHDSRWETHKFQFFADLKNIGLAYKDVADWLAETSRTKRRPSQMVGPELGELVNYLAGGGKAEVVAWLNTRPTGDKPMFDQAAAEADAAEGGIPF